ncbi:aminodeoxychorismate synthase component I [Sulfurimonas sp.]
MSFLRANELGAKGEPFLFLSDFLAQRVEVITLDELDKHDIEFNIEPHYKLKAHSHTLQTLPIDFDEYKKKFDAVIAKICSGETYILNLTQETPIKTSLTLQEIYKLANAHYKLRYKDEFVCFSPEKFIQMHNNKIHTFPMKGTIDASVKNAKEKILHNSKEMAEHTMIVDLLRNDLSIVARDVKVEKFRYIETITAGQKELLQVSSHISGALNNDWQEHIGDILHKLLPAGSISGAPKKSTVGIINAIEKYERGFFSGVFGYYNGESFDSGVMIRFIQKSKNGFTYKSGGGITLDSDAKAEYDELLEKIYLP